MSGDPQAALTDKIGEIRKYDFRSEDRYVYRARKGLDAQVVAEVSAIKGEPAWMREFRLRSLEIFQSKPLPRWGGDIQINFDELYYYLKPTEKQVKSWDEVPEDIKRTFD